MSGKFNIYNFGPWLKREMKAQKIRNKDLAEAAGISEQAICMYKRCDRFPTYEVLTAILDALGYEIRIDKIREASA